MLLQNDIVNVRGLLKNSVIFCHWHRTMTYAMSVGFCFCFCWAFFSFWCSTSNIEMYRKWALWLCWAPSKRQKQPSKERNLNVESSGGREIWAAISLGLTHMMNHWILNTKRTNRDQIGSRACTPQKIEYSRSLQMFDEPRNPPASCTKTSFYICTTFQQLNKQL